MDKVTNLFKPGETYKGSSGVEFCETENGERIAILNNEGSSVHETAAGDVIEYMSTGKYDISTKTTTVGDVIEYTLER